MSRKASGLQPPWYLTDCHLLACHIPGDIVNCPHRVGGIGKHIQTAHLARNAFPMSPSASPVLIWFRSLIRCFP